MCSYVEKNAEFKNQNLKRSADAQTGNTQGNAPGLTLITKQPQNGGYPIPGICFDLHCTSRIISYFGCQMVPWDLPNAMPLKVNRFWLCENVWLPCQPVMQFSRNGYTYKINYILFVTYHRLLIFIQN